MRAMVAVLLMAVLIVPLARFVPALGTQIDATFSRAAAPISPPLMYAGIRG